MFRILKISSIAKTACQHKKLPHLTFLEGSHFTVSQRFYSKKDDCPECSKPVVSTIRPEVPKCKPVDGSGKPCDRQPPVCMPPGKKHFPMYNECPAPNLMDTMPKLQCPHQVHDGRQKKTYLYVLILGALAFLISAATVYKVGSPKCPDTEGRRKVRKKSKRKFPAKSSDIPSSIPYLLIGGGTASFAAFRAIKSAHPEAKVLVIASEVEFPYMRPPLSKELWFSPDEAAVNDLIFKQWNGTERSVYYEPPDFYLSCAQLSNTENGGVAVARGWTVTHVDVVERKAYLDDGYEISYDKCLIATGAIPRNLDIFSEACAEIKEKVSLFKEVFDFQYNHDIVSTSESIAIIGGGFLGSELACSLAKKGKNKLRVTQIFREDGNMAKILPEYLSKWTMKKVTDEGVNVLNNAEVTGARINGDKLDLTLNTGRTVSADHVIVAVGSTPNTTLAEKSDLEVDPELGGYLVNTELQARSHLYIAGDCSCFYDTKLGRRRVEHHDHAVVSGRLAGENMAGGNKPYLHQSMFWSDLGPEVGYEAIGIVDSSLPTVGVFAKATDADSPKAVVTATDEGIRSKTEEAVPKECVPHIRRDSEQKEVLAQLKKDNIGLQDGEDFGKGVIFYLRDDTVVGILLWNVFNRMNIARQVLKDERKYDDLNEVAKLFNIHEE